MRHWQCHMILGREAQRTCSTHHSLAIQLTCWRQTPSKVQYGTPVPTFFFAPSTTRYSAFFGSVWMVIMQPQWWRMENCQMRVLW
jgi:hypothetical protein